MRSTVRKASVAEFQRRGWTVISQVYSVTELAAIQGWCSELFESGSAVESKMVYGEVSNVSPSVMLIKRIEYFCGYHVSLNKFLRSELQLRLVEPLLGGSAVLFKEKINSKFPGASGYPVHQDQQAGWTAFAPIFLTAMICLDDVSTITGGFQIGHGVRQRSLIAGEWSDLNDAQSIACHVKDIHLRAGDVLLFDSYVPHGSGPNLGDKVRNAVFSTYNLASYGDHREAYFALKRRDNPPMSIAEFGSILIS